MRDGWHLAKNERAFEEHARPVERLGHHPIHLVGSLLPHRPILRGTCYENTDSREYARVNEVIENTQKQIDKFQSLDNSLMPDLLIG